MSRLLGEFSLRSCFISDKNTPTLAPDPQTANATARVQVEHTEVKKHYNTLNGYCDQHTHTRFEEVCV